MGSPLEDSTVPGAARGGQGGTAGPCPPVPGRSETQPQHGSLGRADKRVVGAVGRDEAISAGCQPLTGSTSSYLGSHTHPARSQMRAGTLCAADCLTDTSGAGGRGFTGALTRNEWRGGVRTPGLGYLVQFLWWHKRPFLGLHLRSLTRSVAPVASVVPGIRLEWFYPYLCARPFRHSLPPHTGACDTAIASAPHGTGCRATSGSATYSPPPRSWVGKA